MYGMHACIHSKQNLVNEKAIVHFNIFIHILNHTRALVIIILNKREMSWKQHKKGPLRPFYYQLVNMDLDNPDSRE